MIKRGEIYKCKICSNIVMVMNEGEGELVCCKEAMEKLEEKIYEEMAEKHLPVLKKDTTGKKFVQVGDVLHPMLKEHHINWIEIQTDYDKKIKFLDIESEPVFVLKSDEKILFIREYCNIHGLWKGTCYE